MFGRDLDLKNADRKVNELRIKYEQRTTHCLAETLYSIIKLYSPMYQ